MGTIKQSNPILTKQPPVSLYDLAQETEPVLIDTCGLLEINNAHERNLQGLKRRIKFQDDSLDFFLEQIKEQGNFYFTSGIIREVTCPPNYTHFPGHILNKVKPLIDKHHGKAVDFACEVENLGRILKLNEKEQGIYKNMFAMYGITMNKNYLSPQDKDFLISGLVLVRNGRSPIGITNDRIIHTTWENLMAKERNDEEQFKLYMRTGFESFEPLDFSKIPTQPTYDCN